MLTWQLLFLSHLIQCFCTTLGLKHPCICTEHISILLYTQVKCFIEEIPPPGIYGKQEHTLLSLVMTHIKMTTDAEGRTVVDNVLISPSGEPVINTFTKFLQKTDEVSEIIYFSLLNNHL